MSEGKVIDFDAKKFANNNRLYKKWADVNNPTFDQTMQIIKEQNIIIDKQNMWFDTWGVGLLWAIVIIKLSAFVCVIIHELYF
jgi:hypothetical protein